MKYSLPLVSLAIIACCGCQAKSTFQPAVATNRTNQTAEQALSSAATNSGSSMPELARDAVPTDTQLKNGLTAQQYFVLREGGTEAPFTSPLLHETRAGTFVTADCGEPVFRSEQKFDSGTGWPSFTAPITPDAVVLKVDTSLAMERTEVISKKCASHLGHVFDDGPLPTGKRYCINGAALRFVPDAG